MKINLKKSRGLYVGFFLVFFSNKKFFGGRIFVE
jgi:hypothetical protein